MRLHSDRLGRAVLQNLRSAHYSCIFNLPKNSLPAGETRRYHQRDLS